MKKTPLILTATAIFVAQWWLWPVFHLQLSITFLPLFLLAVVFLDREPSDKIFLALGLLLAVEFKAGGQWGLETLSFLITLLVMRGMGKIVIFSSQNFFVSFGWLLFWYHLYYGLSWAIEVAWAWRAEPGVIFLSGRHLHLLAPGSFWQLAVGAVFFLLGYLFLKKLAHA